MKQLSEHTADDTGRWGCFERRQLFARLEQRDTLLDLAFGREAVNLGLGEHHPAIDQHVELATRSGPDLRVFAEPALE